MASGFDGNGFLNGGQGFDWRGAIKKAFDGVNNRTDKVIALLKSIQILLGGNPPTPPTGNPPTPPTGNPPTPPTGNPPTPPTGNPPTPPTGNPPRPSPPRQRDSNGRFTGGDSGNPPTGNPPVGPPPTPPAPRSEAEERRTARERDSNGRFTGGDSEPKSFIGKAIDKISGFFGGIKDALSVDTENVDPVLNAAQETASLAGVLLKPMGMMFKGGKFLLNLIRPKRTEVESVGWLKKLFAQMRGIRQDNNQGRREDRGNRGGSGSGDSGIGQFFAALGGGASSLLGMLAPLLMSVLIPALGLAGAFKLGEWLGKKIYDFIEPVLTPLIDGIAAIPEKIGKAWDKVIDIASKGIEVIVDSFTKTKDKVKGAYDATVNAASKGIENTVNTASALKSKAMDVVDGVVNTYDNARTSKAKLLYDPVKQAMAFKGDKTITGLSDTQTRAYAANVAKTESGGRVDADNKQGYFGQYQFGAEALIESGLVKKDKLAAAKKASGANWYKKRSVSGEVGGHEAFLRDKSNWNTEGGLDEFLKSKQQQDNAFTTYTNKNIKTGINSKAISADSSPAQIAGYAKASHLVGAGAANKLYKNGIDKTDGNNTSARAYAAQGIESITIEAQKVEAAKQAQRAQESAKPYLLPDIPSPLKPVNQPIKPYSGIIPTSPFEAARAIPSTNYVGLSAMPQIVPPTPMMPKVPTTPQVSTTDRLDTPKIELTAKVEQPLVSQDVRSRTIAHVLTGGIAQQK